MGIKFDSLMKSWDRRIGYSKADPVKNFIKFVAGVTNTTFVQRILAYSVLQSQFNNLKGVQVLEKREEVWKRALQESKNAITYVEFGVYKGESICYFSQSNSDLNSIFIGLDSFEGLPEAWAGNPAGYFTTSGVTPKGLDFRTKFIKGYFNQTWEVLRTSISGRTNLLVHYDADLYSSTLFALSKMDTFHQEYIAIFDEFSGDEVRALSDYMTSYSAKVEFIAMQKWRNYPEVVLCKIAPLGCLGNEGD